MTKKETIEAVKKLLKKLEGTDENNEFAMLCFVGEYNESSYLLEFHASVNGSGSILYGMMDSAIKQNEDVRSVIIPVVAEYITKEMEKSMESDLSSNTSGMFKNTIGEA